MTSTLFETLEMFIELLTGALLCKRRRKSVWQHPLWVIRFYWRAARERIEWQRTLREAESAWNPLMVEVLEKRWEAIRKISTEGAKP